MFVVAVVVVVVVASVASVAVAAAIIVLLFANEVLTNGNEGWQIVKCDVMRE